MLKVNMVRAETPALTSLKDLFAPLDAMAKGRAMPQGGMDLEEMDEPEHATEPETHETPVMQILRVETANALALWANYKRAHWEMKGPRFHELHEQFGEWADEAYGTIDDLAERLRMLHGHPPQCLCDFSDMATVPKSIGTCPEEMLEEAYQNVQGVIRNLRRGAAEAQKLNDPGSVDLFSKFVQIYEKQCWFLRQFLQPE